MLGQNTGCLHVLRINKLATQAKPSMLSSRDLSLPHRLSLCIQYTCLRYVVFRDASATKINIFSGELRLIFLLCKI